MQKTIKAISLHYQDERSDKIYNAAIDQVAGGYVVNFAFGWRGADLTPGTKTNTPVELSKAEKIFAKLVSEKTSKGYRDISQPTGSVSITTNGAEDSGIRCQLLNAVSEDQADAFLDADAYLSQPKWDGRRCLIEKKGKRVQTINRNGQYVGSTLDLAALAGYSQDFILDGELLGDLFKAFDLLSVNGKDIRGERIETRLREMEILVTDLKHESIEATDTAFTRVEKREMFAALKECGCEGIVFKKKGSLYTSGKPVSGGDQLKCKFYKTASFIVSAHNTQRSVALSLMDGAKEVSVGNVTIPANHQIPPVGGVVEVRYLYAYENSKQVYQPVYLGERSDIKREECKLNQLIFQGSEQ